MLALQAAAQNLDGGGLVVSGAQVAQARRRRGVAARGRWQSRATAEARWSCARAAAERRRTGEEQRRRGGDGSRGRRKLLCETDAWGPRKS